jgi:hypothetical protein
MFKSQNFLLTFLSIREFCHSRENGNPEPMKRKYWIPAFAGMTATVSEISNILG